MALQPAWPRVVDGPKFIHEYDMQERNKSNEVVGAGIRRSTAEEAVIRACAEIKWGRVMYNAEIGSKRECIRERRRNATMMSAYWMERPFYGSFDADLLARFLRQHNIAMRTRKTTEP